METKQLHPEATETNPGVEMFWLNYFLSVRQHFHQYDAPEGDSGIDGSLCQSVKDFQ